jgi:ubiquitin-conjugating enzyme E2 variant
MIFSIVGQIVLGWLLADLATGVFHWWEDTFGNESWPIIGKWIIVPNALHHKEPLAFEKNGFIGRNLAAIVTALIVGSMWFLLFGLSVFSITFLIGSAIANEIHYFSHRPSKAPKAIKLLQETGILQSPKQHAKHHKPPFDTNFCVMTNWLNPLLEHLNFWKRR